jgi:hypothetical protein
MVLVTALPAANTSTRPPREPGELLAVELKLSNPCAYPLIIINMTPREESATKVGPSSHPSTSIRLETIHAIQSSNTSWSEAKSSIRKA